ncbi:hypothetical protein T265_05501 [Opisthorchis viverrini]|uniref:Uncharacterized protein n=1 Tax=Opisthorchis viverrini TaxID=6198 RepID=A0A074ZNU3_OPIVI|nr:hypothetical protein T265_05501 [Opisthorchis viverrini]KER27467.1 hypothetical protein T265_05501 [Opisthorchis viverrini]
MHEPDKEVMSGYADVTKQTYESTVHRVSMFVRLLEVALRVLNVHMTSLDLDIRHVTLTNNGRVIMVALAAYILAAQKRKQFDKLDVFEGGPARLLEIAYTPDSNEPYHLGGSHSDGSISNADLLVFIRGSQSSIMTQEQILSMLDLRTLMEICLLMPSPTSRCVPINRKEAFREKFATTRTLHCQRRKDSASAVDVEVTEKNMQENLRSIFGRSLSQTTLEWEDCGRDSGEDICGGAISLGMTVPGHRRTDMLRFMDSSITVVMGDAIGEGIRSAVAASSEWDGD